MPRLSSVRAGLALTAVLSFCLLLSGRAFAEDTIAFKPVPWQFIAALGDPSASSGTGAETWGHWEKDPGPTGVWLRLFPVLKAAGGYAPGNWQFNENDWWLDENGLLMQQPEFPMPAGRYIVTGEREVTTMLTVHPKDENGKQRWELADGAQLHEVTHLPCRSARYSPVAEGQSCSPSNVDKTLFKIPPGSLMPEVPGCNKQDYWVLIVIAVEA